MNFNDDKNAIEVETGSLNESCLSFQLPHCSESLECDHLHHRILNEVSESIGKSSLNYINGVGNLANYEEFDESMAKEINDQELVLNPEVTCSKHPNKEKVPEKEDHTFSDCQRAFQGLGINAELKYIDDLSEKNSCSLTCEHLDKQLMHQFIVHDNILTDQVNESFSTWHHKNTQVEDNGYFVLSTSLSKLAKIPTSWGELLYTKKSHSQKEGDLDCDVSFIENECFHDSSMCSLLEQSHSTPIQHKVLPLEKEEMSSFGADSDEDDDIEENYLDTLWTSNGTPNLPSCSLIVKCLKNFQEDWSHSMICKMDEVGDESLSVQVMADYVPPNIEESGKTAVEEPFPSIRPLIDSSSDTLSVPAAKMSYKDKLMEGLSNATSPKIFPSVRKESAPAPFVKDTSLLNLKSLRDENYNLTTNDSKKPTECSSVPNLAKSNNDVWNERKSKKSAPKRAHNSGPNSRTGLDNTDNSSTFINTSKNKGKVDKISKECPHDVMHSLGEAVSTPERKLIRPKISHFSEVAEEKRGCDDKTPSQLTKRQSRKLKKFYSLDLSELQETSDAKASKINQKWKSQDDLDNSNALPLKADNYLLWPLVGLAVLAGFVAFCFRDKISFMIASRFPFERPPI